MPKKIYPRHQEKKPRNVAKHIDTLKSRVRRKDPVTRDSPSTSKGDLPRHNRAREQPRGKRERNRVIVATWVPNLEYPNNPPKSATKQRRVVRDNQKRKKTR